MLYQLRLFGLLSKLRNPNFEEFCHVYDIVCLVESLFVFVFVALRPMSTAMVIAGRTVHFPGQA